MIFNLKTPQIGETLCRFNQYCTQALYELARFKTGKAYDYRLIEQFKIWWQTSLPIMLCARSFEIPEITESRLVEKALESSAKAQILRNKADIVDLIQFVQACCQRTGQTETWSELVLSHFSEDQLAKIVQVNLIDQQMLEAANQL